MFKIKCSGIVFTGNAVTLVRDEDTGILRLPGGMFDGIGDPIDYAQRAILQETGYTLQTVRLFKVTQENNSAGRVTTIRFVFGCQQNPEQTATPTREVLHLTPDDVIRRAAKNEITDRLLIFLITDYKQGGQLVANGRVM